MSLSGFVFHNVGSQQEAGLIVMSVSDGNCCRNEYSMSTMTVFWWSSTPILQERSFTVDLPGLEGMELHPVQASSVDPVCADGTGGGDQRSTVPAHTAAVFVKPTEPAPAGVFRVTGTEMSRVDKF